MVQNKKRHEKRKQARAMRRFRIDERYANLSPTEQDREDWQEITLILRKIGFRDYAAYLEGNLWHQLKAKALTRNNGRCKFCDGESNRVFPTAYDEGTFLGKCPKNLVALCEDHYWKVLLDWNRPRTLNECLDTYDRIWYHVRQRRDKEDRRRLHGYCRICGLQSQKGKRWCRKHEPKEVEDT